MHDTKARLALASAISICAVLSACGGGGSSAADSAIPLDYPAPTRAVGDQYTWRVTQTMSSSNQTISTTITTYTQAGLDSSSGLFVYQSTVTDASNALLRTVSQTTNADHSATLRILNPDGALIELLDYDSSGLQADDVTYTAAAGSNATLVRNCTWSNGKRVGPTFPLHVGDAWSVNGAFSCTYSDGSAPPPAYLYAISGNVLDQETISVNSVTYTAAKTRVVYAFSPLDSATNAPTGSETTDCWYSPTAKRNVRCETTYRYTSNAPASYVASTAGELMNFVNH